ncbi:inositol transport system permease protein [Klebsiella pneumoniae]|uniref:Inositol transport system permease protein n=1 Tax=Klebsiella pneumoniae TaxID=573 RepID=A0A2X1QKX7_KLEPN|nr:inositol transport system permease protein [Klebsiella pneumoniae]
MPKDTGIFVVMLVIALTFEIAGWYVRDQSFLLNTNRLVLIVLQVAIIGIIAVGVTQVIITTGIDLSSGSVIALAAVVAASLAQTSDSLSPMFPGAGQPAGGDPHLRGIGVGLLVRPDQRFPGDADRYPAVYRHPRDDGFGARSGAVLHSGQPDQLPLRQLYGDRPGGDAGDYLLRDRRRVSHCAEAYPVWQICVCHRRQHDLGQSVRHQRE